MTLEKKQRMLLPMLAQLIQFAYARGYELTLGDAYRDPRVHGIHGETRSYSAPYSNHKVRLAVDLNLFRAGVYLTRTEDYRELGEFWEGLGGSWGGRFRDGNHFSLEHEGRR